MNGAAEIPWLLLGTIAVYALSIMSVALYVERNEGLRRRVAGSPVVYALALGVFNTTWTYYGSVGLAAHSGFLFMAVCMGAVLSSTVWWFVLSKMIRIKARQRLTSIADFIVARYNRSQQVGVFVTLGVLIGSLPYVALQMKAVISSFAVTADVHGVSEGFWVDLAGPLLVAFMGLFTIVVGVRRLDPTEQHQGVMLAVALESVVKLFALLIAGVFIVYVMFDGMGDVLTRAAALPEPPPPGIGDGGAAAYMRWTSLLLLSTFAVLLLPRQFHVAVVEGSQEHHVRTAMWVFPVYNLLLHLFVFPVAMAGLVMGLPVEQADTFLLRLPHMAGQQWLAVLVFLGGFSAGMSMVVISAMTVSTMITNHIVLPLVTAVPVFGGLRRSLLQCRWTVVLLYLSLGYTFYRMVGDAYILVNMGIISFGAAIQFAPAVVGGMFWRRANRVGALWGLGSGFAVWAYTLLLPAFVRSGWVPESVISEGLWGIGWLSPEGLFGLTVLEPLTHSLFWSLTANLGGYVLGSLLADSTDEEDAAANNFVDMDKLGFSGAVDGVHLEAHVSIDDKCRRLMELFSVYHQPEEAGQLVDRCVDSAGLRGQEMADIRQLMALYSEAERLLSGVIGSAAAYKTMRMGSLYSPRETMELSEVYARILADLKLAPEDLAKRVDYYQEREQLLSRHAEELVAANQRLREEVRERRRAQEETREAEQRLRSIYDNAVEGIFQTTPAGRVVSMNRAALLFFGYETLEDMQAATHDIARQHYVDAADRRRFIELLEEKGVVRGFETLMKRGGVEPRWVELNARAIFGPDGELAIIEGFLQDITARKNAERELVRANRFIQDVVEFMPSMMFALDHELRVTLINKAVEEALGKPAIDVVGEQFNKVYSPPEGFEEAVRQALDSMSPVELGRIRRNDGSKVLFDELVVYPLASSERGDVVVRVDDVTERAMLEDVMIQTEKMMSVGGLAAGMAHEINNPLAGILQAVQNMERRVLGDFPANRRAAEELGCDLEMVRAYFNKRGIPDMLTGIRESGERAAGIVINMLDFSRRDPSSRVVVDMRELIDRTVDLASSDYDLKKNYDFRDITIERDYPEDRVEVWCTRGEIEQVLLNLFKNAAQAMAGVGPEKEPPKLSIRLREQGDKAVIEVADNGPGMDETVKRRVFEPFFTTKEAGVGTGLGLSVSYFIITSKHGGEFHLDTQPGKGARFTIRLPLYAGQDKLPAR